MKTQCAAVLMAATLCLAPDARAAIEGYCWPLSAAPGGTIDFMVSSTTTYGVSIVRYVRSGNTNTAVPIVSLPTQPAGTQAVPSTSPWEGCGWAPSFQFTIPAGWASGIYAAECTGSSTHRITFIVRPPDGDHAELAMLANTNTWNAYNDWGGRGKYTNPPAHYLSFLRPNPGARPTRSSPDHLATAELWVHDWLKNNGYDFDVYTDQDFHFGIPGFQNYKALILNTHPEYWTHEMMDRLEAYLAAGGSVLYIGGNGLYERTRYDTPDGTVNEFYPENYCGTSACRKDNYFRNLDPPRPERAVLGVAYRSDLFQTYAPFEVLDASHRFFAGTGLHDGDLIGAAGINGAGASGWEMDTSIPGTAPDGVLVDAHGTSDRGSPPANLELLARGANTDGTNHYGADMTYYRAAGGGGVFAAGSLSFGGSLVIDAVLQQIVRNVLDEFLLGPLAVPPDARGARATAGVRNLPNPFAGGTEIRFALPRAGRAEVRVYDPAGRLVRTLLDDARPAGNTSVSWDGRDAAGRDAGAGIFFVRVVSADGAASRRMLRLR